MDSMLCIWSQSSAFDQCLTCKALWGLWGAQLDGTNVMESSCGGRIFGERRPMERGLKMMTATGNFRQIRYWNKKN
jgi:hypothetical protein